MNNTLIKLSEGHYVIVNDSEIKEGDMFIDVETNEIITCHGLSGGGVLPLAPFSNGIVYPNKDFIKKITHSTKPLEEIPNENGRKWYNKIKHISLSDCQEIEYGYSVEHLAQDYTNDLSATLLFTDGELKNSKTDFIEGFNTAMNLGKGAYTFEQVLDAWELGAKEGLPLTKKKKEKLIQSLLPPTQWKVKFNEDGKLEKL